MYSPNFLLCILHYGHQFSSMTLLIQGPFHIYVTLIVVKVVKRDVISKYYIIHRSLWTLVIISDTINSRACPYLCDINSDESS